MFPIFRFAEVTFRNFMHFGPIFNLTSKNVFVTQLLTACDVIKNDVNFRKYGRDATVMTSLTRKVLENFGEHQPACQIWCSHYFWFRSLMEGHFAPPPLRVKCVGQIASKVGHKQG